VEFTDFLQLDVEGPGTGGH